MLDLMKHQMNKSICTGHDKSKVGFISWLENSHSPPKQVTWDSLSQEAIDRFNPHMSKRVEECRNLSFILGLFLKLLCSFKQHNVNCFVNKSILKTSLLFRSKNCSVVNIFCYCTRCPFNELLYFLKKNRYFQESKNMWR